MTPLRTAALATTCSILALTLPATLRAETDPTAIVDALNAVFGKHDGMRAAHANGICVKGTFHPTGEASDISKAPHFATNKDFPVIGRFSMGGGNPEASNAAHDNARGLALHIDLGKAGTTDMVLLSAPVFVAKSPEQFLTLLQTVATKDPEKIGAFFKANPESTRQAAFLKSQPIPSSYATTPYFGIHAFTLTNDKGEKHIVKWNLLPGAADPGLTDEQAKSKAPDFYLPELKDRLAKGPVTLQLTAIMGEPGDPTDDPTAFWPEDKRKSLWMGTVSFTALEDNATCDAGMFDPNALVDGIEAPAGDQILPLRSSAYAVSLSRRAK